MKLAIIYSSNKLSGRLTRFWTGCYAYHVGFVDVESGTFYDMNLLPRKTAWSAHNYSDVDLFEYAITKEQCEEYLRQDGMTHYGITDYILFAIRPVYHLFGRSTRNANGMICSEMVNVWAIRAGNETPWSEDIAPPSPCDWVRFMKNSKQKR